MPMPSHEGFPGSPSLWAVILSQICFNRATVHVASGCGGLTCKKNIGMPMPFGQGQLCHQPGDCRMAQVMPVACNSQVVGCWTGATGMPEYFC